MEADRVFGVRRAAQRRVAIRLGQADRPTQDRPTLSPNKTTEGYIGGTLTATLVGGALGFAAGFELRPALGLAFAITQMGFCGGLVMSAIKRDAGVKDYGHLIAGHGGAMDRVDSLAFAAPVFFHLVRYFYDAPAAV